MRLYNWCETTLSLMVNHRTFNRQLYCLTRRVLDLYFDNHDNKFLHQVPFPRR